MLRVQWMDLRGHFWAENGGEGPRDGPSGQVIEKIENLQLPTEPGFGNIQLGAVFCNGAAGYFVAAGGQAVH